MTANSLAAVRKMVTVQVPNDLRDRGKAFLISTAKNGIASILNEQTVAVGVRPAVEVYANSPGNSNLETVKLPGPIVALFDHRAAIVKDALTFLRMASPVQSGAYRNNHLILLNGTQVDMLPANLKRTDTITIVNPLPYARRLEIGKTESGRDFVLQVPNRIYERVAKSKLIPKYKNVASVIFGYQELSGAHVIQGKMASHYVAKSGKSRKRRSNKGQAVQAPAIFIKSLGVV